MDKFKMSEDKKTVLGYDGKCPDEITIPDGVEVIEKYAFSGRDNLKKVKFNSCVKTIKSGAFAETGIRAVNLPASVSSLAIDAFSYMTMGRKKYGYPYETPTTLKVDKKNSYYFTDDKCLYEINNGELTLILCFKGSCSSLDVAPGTVRIKKGAFTDCRYLTAITLPDTLATLDEGVFENIKLGSLELPAKTINIGKSELSHLAWSTKIVVAKDNPVYASEENCFIKRDGNKTILLHLFDKNQDSFAFPSYVTHINHGAFDECAKLKNINLPNGLTEIPAETFRRCICLEEIALPANLKSIGAEAFANCTKLRDVIFENGDVVIEENAFDGCKEGQLFFKCPTGTKAEEYAKSHKINLVGESKSDNPTDAFSYTISKSKTAKITAYTSRDSKVIIPGTIDGCPVIAFSKKVFKNNKKITSVAWPAEITIIPKELFFGCSSLEEFIIPEGVTEISEKAFCNCESLTSINIPATVTTIHEKAFECAQNKPWGWEYWNCIKTITGEASSYAAQFAKNVGVKFAPGNISRVEQEAMDKYAYHEVPDGIALDDFAITDDMPMSKSMFEGSCLVSFEIPNEILGKPVVELSVEFHKAEKQTAYKIKYEKIAKTLIIPENLKRIRCPLYGRGIQTISISPKNSALIFDDYAWYEDAGKTLGSLWIDSYFSVTEYTIRDGATCACSELQQPFRLKKLFFPDSFTEAHEGFLSNGFGSSVDAIYANESSPMKNYAEKLKVKFVALDSQDVVFSEDGLTLISCPQLFSAKEYTIPDGVRQIEKYAFKENEHLEVISIPESVESIGEGAFFKCMSLKQVNLPSKMAALPDMLFYYSKNLTTVTWPTNVTKIGKKCFAGTSLQNVVIPDSVVEIEDYAFAPIGCSQNSIESIEIPKSVKSIGISICAGIKDITIYDSIDEISKPAQDFYDDINGCWNSRVGSIGILQYEGYMRGACNSEVYRHAVTVKSAVDNSVKYKVLMYGKEEARNVYCAMVSSWGKNAEFNFARIDEKFSKLKYADNRIETVMNRLTYPFDLADEFKEKYCAWLKSNGAKVASKFIERGDLAGLMSYEQYGIITKNNVQKLIDLAASKK